MARKPKAKINKSAVIREIRKTNPEIGPKEIAQMILEQHGVEVTPATVSTVLSTDKKRNGKVGRPGRPKGSKNAAKSNGHRASNGNGSGKFGEVVENLIKARQLVQDMGGVEQARNALNALESLMVSN